EFAANHEHVFASIGVHPHDTKDGHKIDTLFGAKRLVAVGEIGLDYFYSHSPRDVQIEALQAQIELALKHDLPIIFHVREAFDDFWPIFDNFKGIRGELHSFTDNQINLEEGLGRGLFIGVNGISTFTKDEKQKELFATIPLTKLLLETDAPFLTPVPFRGKVNEPAFVRNVAEHQATIRHMTLEDIARATTTNATALFAL
ncbi:MAG: TatD family hydrolase, partial [Candidatus Saccharibacteria bacterium]